MTDNHQFILTEDGSHTLVHQDLGVTYHSKYGAIQESQTIFIDAGLHFQLDKIQTGTVSILEMGFGTGLNAFMTFLQASKYPHIHFQYTALEAFPISADQAKELNYPQLFAAGDQQAIFDQMHLCPFMEWQQLAPNFEFCKQMDKFEHLQAENAYDLVYYDAFAPTAQPELWTEELFTQIYRAMRSNAVLTTYCAKGSFKRMLRALGFEVNSLPGPKGKREMTQGIKRG